MPGGRRGTLDGFLRRPRAQTLGPRGRRGASDSGSEERDRAGDRGRSELRSRSPSEKSADARMVGEGDPATEQRRTAGRELAAAADAIRRGDTAAPRPKGNGKGKGRGLAAAGAQDPPLVKRETGPGPKQGRFGPSDGAAPSATTLRQGGGADGASRKQRPGKGHSQRREETQRSSR